MLPSEFMLPFVKTRKMDHACLLRSTVVTQHGRSLDVNLNYIFHSDHAVKCRPIQKLRIVPFAVKNPCCPGLLLQLTLTVRRGAVESDRSLWNDFL